MRLIHLLLVTLFATSCCGEEGLLTLKQRLKSDNDAVIVVAHRADWRTSPENSIPAINSAIAMGADMIEIDLKKSKDGVLILMHDKTLDRTTTGKGKPSDYTLEELKKLRLRAGHGQPTNNIIPTFEEVMEICKGKIYVNVDKGYDYFSEVYDVLQRTGTVDQCLIKSSYPYSRVLEENGAVLDKVFFMPIIRATNTNAREIIAEYQKEYQPLAYEICFAEYNEDVEKVIEMVEQSGAKIWINTLWDSLNAGHSDDRAVELNDIEGSWGWVLDTAKADMIQTDRAEPLIKYLKSRGRH